MSRLHYTSQSTSHMKGPFAGHPKTMRTIQKTMNEQSCISFFYCEILNRLVEIWVELFGLNESEVRALSPAL